MMKKLSILILLIVICFAPPLACTAKTTPTPTLSPTEALKVFLNDAKNSYLTGAGAKLEPAISGISAADFLTLTVDSDTILTMNGVSYYYKIPHGENEILGYTVNFIGIKAAPGGGGILYKAQVIKDDKVISEWEFGRGGFPNSVAIGAHSIEKLLVLYISYPTRPNNPMARPIWYDDRLLIMVQQ